MAVGKDRGQDWIPGVASAWEVEVGWDSVDFLLPEICLGFHLCRITSSMASSQQPALLRSQLCHAHLLPEAPGRLQRDPGRSQDHQVLNPGQRVTSRGARIIRLAIFTAVPWYVIQLLQGMMDVLGVCVLQCRISDFMIGCSWCLLNREHRV